MNLLRLYAVISQPFIPFASAKLLQDLGNPPSDWPDLGDSGYHEAMNVLKPGHRFSTPGNLFAKITDEQREAWAARFAGGR